MKILLNIIKFLVLVSAGALAILRFVSFKYEASFSEERLHLFFVLSIVFAAVLLISGGIWVIITKYQEKKEKQ